MIQELPAQVFGLAGICQLFGCGKNTAITFKKTWLAPAVSQRGRIIVTDTAKALELFSQYKKEA